MCEVRDIYRGVHTRVWDSALKFKQARAHGTDEIEAAHGNSGVTPWQRRIQGDRGKGWRFVSRERREAATLSLSLSLRTESIRVPCFDRSTTTKPSAPRRAAYISIRKRILWNFLVASPYGTLIVHRRICMINHRMSRAGIDRSAKRTMTNASVTNLVVQNASSGSELCISGTAAVQIACACRSHLELHYGRVRIIQSDIEK